MDKSKNWSKVVDPKGLTSDVGKRKAKDHPRTGSIMFQPPMKLERELLDSPQEGPENLGLGACAKPRSCRPSAGRSQQWAEHQSSQLVGSKPPHNSHDHVPEQCHEGD